MKVLGTARVLFTRLASGTRWLTLPVTIAGCVSLTAPATQAAPVGNVAHGALIYRQGLLADGRPVEAERAGVGRLPPAAAACVGCHRRSGRGSHEGELLVPPIHGAALFAPGRPPVDTARLQRTWLRHQSRPAYDDASLARAMAAGIDPGNQPLGAVMPRYQLDVQAQADLAAYLRQLGTRPVPGWDGRILQLATVIAPDAPPRRQATVQNAMGRWSDGLGFGDVRVQWRAWELTGSPEQWPAQLDAWQRRQPAFALVSGAGGARWDVVDSWCEKVQLPCVMPVVDHVPERVPEARHWSVHLSAGTVGEASLIAHRLLTAPPRQLLQVHDGIAAAAGAAALDARLAANSGQRAGSAQRRAWPADGARPARGTADVVVLWLPSERAAQWLAQERPAPGVTVLLSAQLAPPQTLALPPAWRGQVLWASLRADPVRQQAGAALSLVPWATSLGLQVGPTATDLADVHAAAYFFGDAMALARGAIDPEYLLERLEVAVDRRPAASAYVRLSLGPGQRVAAQGGYFLGFRGPGSTVPEPVSTFVRVGD